MPDIRILKALKMTAAEWGQLPIDGDERANLRQKALNIISGNEPAVLTRTESFLAIEQARVDAMKDDHLTRAGFEAAMVQQAQMFGEAVEDLRTKNKALTDRVDALEKINTDRDSALEIQFGKPATD